MARPRKGHEKAASAAISARVPAWVKDGLEAIADERQSPYSDVVVEALVAYLKKHGIRKAA